MAKKKTEKPAANVPMSIENDPAPLENKPVSVPVTEAVTEPTNAADARVPVVLDKLPGEPIVDTQDRPTGGMPDERRDNIHYGDDYYDGMSGGYARINVEEKQSTGYARSVGAEPVRDGSRLVWITMIVMAVLCIAVGVLSSTLTGYFMRRGMPPQPIDTEDVRQAVAAVVEARKPSVVEIECGGLRGTGVITKLENNKIYIITNAHVIGAHSTASVRFDGDDDFYSAVTVGYSSYYDIAVVSVTGYNPPHGVYDIEGSDVFDARAEYKDGEYVVAIGNGMSMGIAAYDGIISRSSELLAYDDKTVPVLRTTAAINAGMSGCGLFDMSGRLIGIGTYRMTSLSGASSGHEDDVEDTGFAVPVSVVYPVYKQILESAGGEEESHMPNLTFSKPRTTSIGAITFDLRGYGVFTAEYRNGKLTVVGVDANMAPQGLEFGDVITAIGSVELDSDICATCGEFLRYRSGASRGTVMTLTVKRGAAVSTITVDGYYRHVA